MNHAEENAKAWAASIAEMVAALECDYDRLAELRDEIQSLRAECGELHSDHDTAAMRDARNRLGAWLAENGDELRKLIESATIDGDLMADKDAARERIEQSPLEVQVRGDWHSPGQSHDALAPVEFCVLLSTGGPALRIMGELDEHVQPRRAWLEYQDWGTGWTQYFDVEQKTLLAFCSVFYFGE